jgi:4-amino-4-deoxy-L-arabinose transferase-like glycosyltransferase
VYPGPMIEQAAALSDRRRWGWFVATFLAGFLGVYCLVGTRQATSGTFDESNHLACGIEWWQFGSYTQWTENPPLPRVAIAAVPYLLGTRLPPPAEWDPKTHDWDRSWDMGSDLLYGGVGYETNLRRARWGTLPFFLLALLAVWGLAGGLGRPAVGFLAVALTATLPVLTAHAALATTDIAFVGTFLLATLALWRWFAAPTWGRATALGASVGLALLCKFSTLAFFPILVAAVLLGRRLSKTPVLPRWGDRRLPARRLLLQIVGMFLVGFLVTWAGYRFSVGRIEDLASEVKDWLPLVPPVGARSALESVWLHATLPMPELFHGLRFLAAHNRVGHEAYLLGWISQFGFKTFYPVALLVKTPLPFLALCLLSIVLLVRRRDRRWPALAALLAAAGILLVSLGSQVNIGVRHVAVILPLLAVATALAIGARLERLTVRRWLPAMVGALLLVQATLAVRHRATAIGYFNALAGSEPAKVLLDSDLDWGQDLFALRREANARGIENLTIAFFGTLRQCQHRLPKLTALVPGKPATGWIAISENYYQERSTFQLLKDPCQPKSAYHEREAAPKPFAWLHAYKPVAIVGSSVRLYYVP